jgi:WD40 repeat protein
LNSGFSDKGTPVSGIPLGPVWDSDEARLERFAGHEGPVRSVAFSPDAKLVATTSRDVVHVWDRETGDELRRFIIDDVSANSVAFRRAGDTVVAGYDGESGRLWDLAASAAHRPLAFADADEIAITPDDQFVIATCGRFGLKRVSLPGGETAGGFKHVSDARGLALSADGKRLLTCGGPLRLLVAKHSTRSN